jgi:hypothetical protein
MGGGRSPYTARMIRWVIVIFLALILISWFSPMLQKLGFGKLPGDCRFQLFGRQFFLPFTTTILLSLLCAGIARIL